MKRRNYPANLLHALRLNENLGTSYEYETMPGVEEKVLNQMERYLTERERYSMLRYYKDRTPRKKLAEEVDVTDLRMRQILYRAVRKLQKYGRLNELIK